MSRMEFPQIKSVGPGAVPQGFVVTGDVHAPQIEQTALFVYQSYFDSTLLQNAILSQPPNEPIVPSTAIDLDTACYGVAALPTNQTPIAVRFKAGKSQGGSQVYRLKPGEVLRPFGAPSGKSQPFSGLTWGLPFGWLGGGLAAIRILRTPDSSVGWASDQPEVIYHRARFQIYAANAVPVAASIVKNWPQRFPWPNAVSGANALTQRGQPVLAVSPTRTILRLRMGALAAQASMRMMFVGTNDFGLLSTGAADMTDVASLDMSWSPIAQIGANPGVQYQTRVLIGEGERLAADLGGVVFVDNTGVGTLAGNFVDVVRYGRM